MPGSRRANTWTVMEMVLFAFLVMPACPSTAGIVAVSGDIRLIAPPISVLEGDLQSDSNIVVFVETTGWELPFDLKVNIEDPGHYAGAPMTPGAIPVGTSIDSYFIHGDSLTDDARVPLHGTLTFSTEILGIIVSDGYLDATDPPSRLPGGAMKYPTMLRLRGARVDLAFSGDSLTWSGNTVTVRLDVFNVVDQIRVITRAGPEPVTFSVGSHGVTTGVLDSFSGTPITEGDILTVGAGGRPGPNPPAGYPAGIPGIMVRWDELGIDRSKCLGPASYLVEVDALSYGKDLGDILCFSIDEFTESVHGSAIDRESFYSTDPTDLYHITAPHEASADAFALSISGGAPRRSSYLYDGDGRKPHGYRGNNREGFGLVEPHYNDYSIHDQGDNLDAMDLDTGTNDHQGPIFFSLEGTVPSLTEEPPAGQSGTAERNCFLGGDVLVQSNRFTRPVVYASAADLGLGQDDDLDALALWDDGDLVFDPDKDTILFSVRLGSAISDIAPIDACDVLTVPDPGTTLPRVVHTATELNLKGRTRHGVEAGDLDALDIVSFKYKRRRLGRFAKPYVPDDDAWPGPGGDWPGSPLLIAWDSKPDFWYWIEILPEPDAEPIEEIGPIPATPPYNEYRLPPISERGIFVLRYSTQAQTPQ